MSGKLAAALLAEFAGTFMLCLARGCSVLSGSPEAWGAMTVAAVVCAMTYCFGSISGAHLNPAVTMAAGLTGKFPWTLSALYILTQVIGGIVAALCFCALFEDRASVGPKSPFTWWEAMVVEAFYTAVIAFVALSVNSRRNNPEGSPNQFSGLAIGFTYLVGMHAVASISGGAFNPAVSLGFDLTSYYDMVYQGLAFAGYQMVGAMIAALLFSLTRPEENLSSVDFEHYEPSLSTRLASEFIGTLAVVTTVGLNVLGKSSSAWSVAAAVMSLTYALNDVSGGHFNPAITMAVVVSKKGGTSLRDGIAYISIQVIAASLAAMLFVGLYGWRSFPLAPKGNFTIGVACVLEFMFTLVVAYAYLTTASVKGIRTQLSRNFYFALAVGVGLLAGITIAHPISGGWMSPAVSFGIGLASTMNMGTFDNVFAYSVAESLGGLAAAGLFSVTHAREYSTKLDRPIFAH